MEDPGIYAAVLSGAAAACAIAVYSLIWTNQARKIILWVLALSLVPGQLLRIPLFGQGGGILISDIALVGMIAIAGIVAIRKRRIQSNVIVLASLALIFLAWALLPLVTYPALTHGDLGIAIAYWTRLAALLLLVPALCVLCEEDGDRKTLQLATLISGCLLLIGGIVQYMFAPDLAFLSKQGWDPHIGRLVSTWLDPNFFGIWCVLFILFLIPGQKKHALVRYASMGIVFASLLLTQSRSSWLASGALILLVPAALVAARRSYSSATIRAVGTSLLGAAIIGVVIAGVLFPQRVTGLFTSDATVTLRAQALRTVWVGIVEPHWGIGVGYNAYQFYAEQAGLIGNFAIHSRAGADNTLMTLWATTGVVGLSLFAALWSWVVMQLGLHWVKGYSWPVLVAIAGIIALATHSLFINSFLYVHTFSMVAILIALAWPRQPSLPTEAAVV